MVVGDDRSGLVRLLATSSMLALTWAGAAQAQSSGAVSLDTIEVTGNRSTAAPTTGDRTLGRTAGERAAAPVVTDGYVPVATTVGTKTQTPVLETPQSISVVTREQMDDRGVKSLNEAIAYTPGVTNTMWGYDPRYNAFMIRGFDATYTGVFRDGLRELNGNLAIFRVEPYGLDSIAILRGPSSALYSQSAPGGMVELISRRPQATARREIEVQLGTQERYQGAFDITGPANDDKTLLYRLTGVARDSKTPMSFVPDDILYLAPAVTWAPNADTSLTVLSEISRSVYGGTSAYWNQNGQVDTRLPLGDPNYNDSVQEQSRIGWAFEHRVDDILTVRQNFRYARIAVDYRYAGLGVVDWTAGSASRFHEHYLAHLDTVVVDNQAQVKVATGAISHTILAGVDYAYGDYRQKWGSNFTSSPPLNLDTLDYGSQYFADPAITSAAGLKQHQTGVYLQDQARLGELLLTLGGRHDWLTRDYYNLGVGGEREDSAWSGRVGLTWLTSLGIAPYVSYSTSFSPMLTVANNGGDLFAPTTAQGGEVGVKYKPEGINALFTVALFDIDQQNVVVYDPATLDSRQFGAVHSRGLEVEATTSLKNGFSGSLAYTYLDLEVTEGLATEVGRMPSGVPNHQVAVWANYKVPEEHALRGLGMGMGVRWIGPSWGDDSNTFRNDSAYVIDGMLGYDVGGVVASMKGVELKVNATNLLGEQYTTCKGGYCYLSEDRRVIGSVKYRW